jgi:transposase
LSERAELAKLRKDNAQLQMDNAFLKKAAAWFASENK